MLDILVGVRCLLRLRFLLFEEGHSGVQCLREHCVLSWDTIEMHQERDDGTLCQLCMMCIDLRILI